MTTYIDNEVIAQSFNTWARKLMQRSGPMTLSQYIVMLKFSDAIAFFESASADADDIADLERVAGRWRRDSRESHPSVVARYQAALTALEAFIARETMRHVLEKRQ